jgi:murein DD-endopeptidase MepM/ murein hydrolase activator NlpD
VAELTVTAPAAVSRAGAVHAALPRALSALVVSYGQVLFTEHRGAGALLLAATLLEPRVGLHGLAAVAVGQLLARALRLSGAAAARGHYGYNPLLVGLAVGALFEPGTGTAALLALAVAAVVIAEAALDASLGAVLGLPALSLPFLAVTWAVLAAAPLVGVVARAAPAGADAALPVLGETGTLWLRSLGALFFVPSPAAGALVLAALLLHSRIAVLLAALGLGLASVLAGSVFTFATDGALLVLHLNAVLVAIALGGVWFVPQRSSFLLAAGAVLVAALTTAASHALLLPLGVPVLILPFNLTLLAGLTAMRQRVHDGAPKAVDFVAGAPEANLAYYRTRLARFGPLFAVRLAPPCSGRWVVTQGVDGRHTHRGPWRHALDLEVADATGVRHAGAGRDLADYRCYRLPVLACADGTVVKVVSDVPDNAPGERNVREPWGNLVVLHHAPALYSVVAHLAPGSVEVREGQVVRQGQRLGRCGNSGRSFVPHLHFQLQASARVGAPTLELELAEVLGGDDAAPVLHRRRLPVEGEAVRGLVRQEEVAAVLAFPIGATAEYEVSGAGRTAREEVASRIGLLGELYLESSAPGAVLWFETQGRAFVVFDEVGPRGSVLHLLATAAPRVPYALPDGLRWDDLLPARRFRPTWTRWASDLAGPFLPDGGIPVVYRAERRGGAIVVNGEGRVGSRRLATRAVFDGRGLADVEVALDGEVRRARRTGEVSDG